MGRRRKWRQPNYPGKNLADAVDADATLADDVVGLCAVASHRDDPPGSVRWRLTRDVNKLLLGNGEFLGCVAGEAGEVLAARHPAAHELLTRVLAFPQLVQVRDAVDRWGYEKQPHEFVVLREPFLEAVAAVSRAARGSVTLSATGDAVLVTPDEPVRALEEFVRAHGPLLVTAAAAAQLRGKVRTYQTETQRQFRASALVVTDLPGAEYALLKCNLAAARARQTRTANEQARRARECAHGAAAAQLRAAIDTLARAILADLACYDIAAVLSYQAGSHSNDDWEPRLQSQRRGRYVGAWSGDQYSVDNPRFSGYYQHHIRRGCLEQLLALCLVHARFRGPAAWRRLTPWEAMRREWRALPADVDPERWGMKPGRPRMAAFWEAEMRARRRKPRPYAGQVACDDCQHFFDPAGPCRPVVTPGKTPADRPAATSGYTCPRCGSVQTTSIREDDPYAARGRGVRGPIVDLAGHRDDD